MQIAGGRAVQAEKTATARAHGGRIPSKKASLGLMQSKVS